MSEKNGLKSKISKNKTLNGVANAVRKLHVFTDKAKIAPGIFLRGKGFNDKKYSALRELKDKYNGERCFIIATGPSLTKEDILSLENEYTFGMNSIAMLFKDISWRPTFFGVQDLHVYDKISDYFEAAGDKTIKFTDNMIAEKRGLWDSDWVVFPLNRAYHSYEQVVKNEYFVKFSDDCYKVVYNGYSITFSLLQIAMYLGFKEIYLLGADCTFMKGAKNHFIEHGHNDHNWDTAQARNFAMYEGAKEYADKNGIKIFNATRGGALEIFPRVDFDGINKK